MIVLNIDVTKIDKSRLYVGKKGKYLELVVMENRNGEDQYGNTHMVVQGVTKEERAQGVKGAILGNGKTIGEAPARQQQRPAQRQQKPSEPDEWTSGAEDDDIPF